MAYTTIERSFWTDPLIRSLSIKERYLYLYLLTNHHAHYSGIYYLPYTYIIEESGVTKKEIDVCFEKLCKKIKYDNDTNVIWIVNMFKYQNSKGGNPKVIYSGIEKHFKNLHSFTLIREFILKYREFIPTLNQGWFKDASRLRQPIGTDSVTDTDVGTGTDKEDAEKIKHIYGEYKKVRLTDKQVQKLKDKLNGQFDYWIKELDEGIENKGYKYNNHYLTILKWVEKEAKKNNQKGVFNNGKQDKYDGLGESLNTE